MIDFVKQGKRAALAAFFVSGLATAVPVPSDPMAEDVVQLMSNAYRDLAWQGTLVYTKDQQMVSLKVHRDLVAGQPVERLERLSGDSVQLMRRGNWLLGLYPGQEVLKQGYSVPTAQVPALSERLAHIKQHYQLTVFEPERVAGRVAIPIKLTSADSLRFHRMFWCDQETGLLLRSQILDNNAVLEQFEFLDVDLMPASNRDTMVVDAQGKEVHRHPLVPSDVSDLIGLAQLPAGFMPLHQSRLDDGSASQLITDGLSMISLFYEYQMSSGHTLQASDGPTHAHSITVPASDGWLRITAVGEVPSQTLVSLVEHVKVPAIETLLANP